MLILSRYLKAVILTTYLCSLSHLVENRHMFNSEDQNLEPRLNTRLSSLPSVAVHHSSVRRTSPNITSPATHHRHRHKHNLINNVNNSDSLDNLNKRDKDKILRTHHNNNNNNNDNSPQNDHISTSRPFLLFNRCSNHYIHVFDKQIHARAIEDNPYSMLSLETLGGNDIGLRIRSDTGLYVCFNKRGKLVTRYIGDNLACVFTEEYTESRYVKYRSLYNPDWYMGFNKKGNPIIGKIPTELEPQQHRRRQKCYQFSKISPKKSRPEPIPDSSHEVLHNYDRSIADIKVKPRANGNTDVINSRNMFRVKPNDKSVLRLMRTTSEANSKQLIYSFSNYNNFNDYNNNENLSTNPSINSHNSNVRPIVRQNGRAFRLTANQ